jgi:2-oxoglutarate ferredoxin oxidoreductase subunit alpha
VERLQVQGRRVSHLHLRHLNPLPADLEGLLRSFRRVVVPELNLGQLLGLLRARFLVDARGIHKVQGKPFRVSELLERLEEHFSP